MFRVKIQYNGIDVDCSFTSEVCMLSGYSGTGKTLLMKATELYCLDNDVSCRYCDFRCRDMDSDQIITMCKNAKVVLLDNADLYLDNELLSKLIKMCTQVIICMKDTSAIDMYGITEYFVNYENMKIITEVLG